MWKKLSKYIIYSLLFIGSCSESEYGITPRTGIPDESPVEVGTHELTETVTLLSPDIRVTPLDGELGSLDVLLSESFEQSFTIFNKGSAVLDVTSIVLELDYGVFSLEDSDPRLIQPQKTDEFILNFHPDSSGLKEEYIIIESNDPDEPLIRIPLSGEGLAPQIEVTPMFYDYGNPLVACPEELEMSIKNIGTTNLEVSKATYSSTPDFSFVIDPILYGEAPWTITPGDEILGTATYEAYDEVYDISYLTVESNDPLEPVVVASHVGEAVRVGTTVDSFVQTGLEQVDILFVIDNSCSMGDEQANLALNATTFITTLDASGADYRLAVITTDDPTFAGPVLSPGYGPDLITEFESQLVTGVYGSAIEMGLEMAYLSVLPGGDAEPGGIFQRTGAILSIVFVSDEDDWSSESVDMFYVPYFQGLKSHPDKVLLHAVIDDPNDGIFCGMDGYRYLDAVALTGGVSSSICTSTWATDLEDLADGATMTNFDFQLSNIPLADSIEVYVNGILTYGWSYDPVGNSVVFAGEREAPDEGDLVEITYGHFGECP